MINISAGGQKTLRARITALYDTETAHSAPHQDAREIYSLALTLLPCQKSLRIETSISCERVLDSLFIYPKTYHNYIKVY